MAELDERPYEWAEQQNCRICALSHFGLFRYPAGHYLCWLLLFTRANLGTQSHQDTKMWLSVTC